MEVKTNGGMDWNNEPPKAGVVSRKVDVLVGYPMLINKEMTPVFVIAENMAKAIDIIEATGVTEWEFQHSTSYQVIANTTNQVEPINQKGTE